MMYEGAIILVCIIHTHIHTHTHTHIYIHTHTHIYIYNYLDEKYIDLDTKSIKPRLKYFCMFYTIIDSLKINI